METALAEMQIVYRFRGGSYFLPKLHHREHKIEVGDVEKEKQPDENQINHT